MAKMSPDIPSREAGLFLKVSCFTQKSRDSPSRLQPSSNLHTQLSCQKSSLNPARSRTAVFHLSLISSKLILVSPKFFKFSLSRFLINFTFSGERTYDLGSEGCFKMMQNLKKVRVFIAISTFILTVPQNKRREQPGRRMLLLHRRIQAHGLLRLNVPKTTIKFPKKQNLFKLVKCTPFA